MVYRRRKRPGSPIGKHAYARSPSEQRRQVRDGKVYDFGTMSIPTVEQPADTSTFKKPFNETSSSSSQACQSKLSKPYKNGTSLRNSPSSSKDTTKTTHSTLVSLMMKRMSLTKSHLISMHTTDQIITVITDTIGWENVKEALAKMHSQSFLVPRNRLESKRSALSLHVNSHYSCYT